MAEIPLQVRAVDLIKTGDWAGIDPGVVLLSTDDAAKALDLSQPTILQWIAKGKLLGLCNTTRGYRIPLDTLIEGRAAIPGMAYVINEICGGHHNLAWSFLTSVPADDGRPAKVLDLLRSRDLDTVIRAATSWADGYTIDGAARAAKLRLVK